MKKQLAEDMIGYIAPIRKKLNELLVDEDHLSKVVLEGREKAWDSASKTLADVKTSWD